MMEIVFFIAEVLIIAGYALWDHLKLVSDRQTAFELFVVYEFSLLLLYLLARSYRDRKRVEEVGTEMKAEISTLGQQIFNNATALYQDQFYAEFRQQIMQAATSVDMTYLDTNSPFEAALKRSDMRKYYEQLLATIRSRPTVHFRRVERASPQKREWIESMVAEMEGKTHFSLAFLVTTDANRKIPAVSVQLIDARRTYLVAVRNHTSPSDPRDIRISDKECTELWRGYYEEMLWGQAIKVIEHGVVNQSNWLTVQKALVSP